MKTIGYLVPYFGTLPKNMQLWLKSCAANPTIDWILLTDDKTEYNYPANVKVKYCSFESLKERIQNAYDFPVQISSAWNLSLFKPAYGEIFAEELAGYDFWGHCDVDVIWGNIRKFITDDVLNKYEKIGFQGHSLLYKNTPEVNARYKICVDGKINYKQVFGGEIKYSFDENGMDDIYNHLNIPYYKEITFAHMRKYAYRLSVGFVPKNEEYKNECQIFEWKNGTLLRHYVYGGKLYTEEFMYIHFFCRPMKYLQKNYGEGARYIIYPDCVKDFNGEIDVKTVKRLAKNPAVAYYAKSIWANRHKLTPKKIMFNIKNMIKRKLKK